MYTTGAGLNSELTDSKMSPLQCPPGPSCPELPLDLRYFSAHSWDLQCPVQCTHSLPWQSSCSAVIRAEDTDRACAQGCSDRGAQGTETKHPPPSPRGMETAVPSRGRNTQHETQPGSARAGEHTRWRREKAWPFRTTPAVPLTWKEEDEREK